jgi:phage terminase large subunit
MDFADDILVELRGAPRDLLRSILDYTGKVKNREVIVVGPGGTGKSRGICYVLAYLCETHPGLRVLLTRSTRESMTSSTLVEWEACFPPEHPVLDGPQREGRSIYHFPNGSEVAVIGLDKPGKLFSTKWDIIYAEELTGGGADSGVEKNTWELFFRGLRGEVMVNNQRLLIGSCNPSYPSHWVKQRIDAGSCEAYLSVHKDNPAYHDGVDWTDNGRAYLDGLGRMSGHNKRRLLHGEWCAATGRVYDAWDDDVHVVDATVWTQRGQATVVVPDGMIPMDWCFASFDWGWTDPAVLQVWGVDKDRRLWMLAEVFKTRAGEGTAQSGLDWFAERVSEFYKEFDLRALVYDPSRAETGEKFNRRISFELGFDVPSFAIKAMNRHGTAQDFGGIDMVRSLLSRRVQGRPQMNFVKNTLRFGRDEFLRTKGKPTCTVEEFPAYVYEEPKEGRSNRDKPADGQSDHGLDAARYAAAYFWTRDMGEPSKNVRCPRGTVGHNPSWPGGKTFEEWFEGQDS